MIPLDNEGENVGVVLQEDSLKSKKEELTDALCLLTEELYEEEERVQTLTEERDQFQEAHSDIEVGIVKLDAEKKEASVAFEAFNTAKEEFERISTHLLQLVKQKGGIANGDRNSTLTVKFEVIYELKDGGVDERRLVGAKLEKLAEGHTGTDTVTIVLHKQVITSRVGS
ncbi:hypothetical protein POM88_054448 [Heracleum sosnowskyi]|uniref:Uncharacterized protein n=1 Tax=Heracleum sosnowskyi TaxID=360622 RepID=A0AAD8LW65_9APIA|nr:hypothetical protein POM88_054448 [Heracleum sosnowskyi]